MQSLFKLDNPIQNYAWGSKTAIAELLGRPMPSSEPQAELWMGAHPKAPSMTIFNGRRCSLIELIQHDPIQILGADSVARFGRQLPFLFKALAAATPLSIQAHPSKREAQDGFARENQQQIAVNAPWRNYKDDNHKPESVCALSPFWALFGFRPAGEIAALLEQLCPVALSDPLRMLAQGGLKPFFQHLMALDVERHRTAAVEALQRIHGSSVPEAEARWMIRLQESFPGDVGVLAPVMLNLVCLQPGQGLNVSAGVLHAYLEGVGMELMANSDNVIRGGLTAKHVDVSELLRVLSFGEGRPEILRPRPVSPTESLYPPFADEFKLSLIQVKHAIAHQAKAVQGAEILFCTQGRANVTPPTQTPSMAMAKGEAVLVAAHVPGYRIDGHAVIYRAAVA